MAEVFHRSLFLQGPAGQLEAMLWTPAPVNPDLAAIVCHPHPLFGGTMHNKVVFQTAKTLHQRDIAVLRFNFRGVGHSEGVHVTGRASRTTFARRSIISPPNFRSCRFWSQDSVSAHGWGSQ